MVVELREQSELKMPTQFGPRKRIPRLFAISLISRSSSRPLSPVTSLTPPEITIALRIPALPHSSSTWGTTSVGSVSWARSTGLPTSMMLLYAGIPRTCLLYTSDAADDLLCVDLGGRRIIKKKKKKNEKDN